MHCVYKGNAQPLSVNVSGHYETGRNLSPSRGAAQIWKELQED